MKYIGMKKVADGRFIDRYDLEYETASGKKKVYEMITRDHGMATREDLTENAPEAVILIVTDSAGERILINREFRLAAGRWVYNFPAGLIDPGETPEEAAARELREETGLRLDQIDDRLGISYAAVGFCNEKNITIVGRASGSFRKSTSEEEEIEPGWYTKAEVRELLRAEPFAARTQAFCYAWSRED